MIVSQTKARSSGSYILVIDNRSGEFMDDDQRWYTVCDTHSMLVGHETRALAMSWRAEPETWCSGCREVIDARS